MSIYFILTTIYLCVSLVTFLLLAFLIPKKMPLLGLFVMKPGYVSLFLRCLFLWWWLWLRFAISGIFKTA